MLTTVTTDASEQGTFVVRYSFLDEDGVAAAPNALAWTLLRSPGVVVNEREAVPVTPASTVNIVLSGDDLALWPDEKPNGVRHLFVAGTYDSTLGEDLPYTAEVIFDINDLMGVDPVEE